jgi:hypothetical protein
MADDLGDDLEAWGATPTPDPDPAFARRLEADLRSQAYFAANAPERQPGNGPRPFLRPALLVFSSIVVLVGAFLFLRSDDPDQLIMGAATGTRVVVPDETPVAGSPGLALPDGTRITVDAGGSAVIDGIVLGGGTRALVVDGRIEVLVTEPTPTSRPTTPTPSITARPEATTAPDGEPTPDPTPTAAVTVTPAPATSPTPAPTSRPTPTPDSDRPRPEPTDQPRPSPTATTPPPPVPAFTVTLDIVRLSAERARLVWSVESDDGVSGFEIVLNAGDRRRTVAVLRDPSTRELEIEVPDAESATFVVVARDSAGAVLGRSEPAGVPPTD